MPNWCENTARFFNPSKGLIDRIQTELETVDEDGFPSGQLFNLLRPCPLDQADDWYNWNVTNWGTKWDASEIRFQRNDDYTVTVFFETAWAPPIALYEYLVAADWQIEALAHEPGMAFVSRFLNGALEEYEYDISDPDSKNDIPQELVEWAGLEDAFLEYQESQD